jgi:tRNA G46 methylase TrmB
MKDLKVPKRVRNHVNPFSYKKENSFNGFANNNPIIIDIGSYRGEFGQRLLNKFKVSKNFIFFEIRIPFFEYLKNLFKKNSNVQVFDGDAGYSLENILKKPIKNNIKIEKIFINFPDP